MPPQFFSVTHVFPLRQILQSVDRQTEAINGHLKVAESQSANISEPSKLVATQASTVDFLIRRMGA